MYTYKLGQAILLSRLARILKTSAHSNNAGFTLLELLIVIIVLGILFAMAIPTYVDQTDKARYGKAKIQMDCIAKELQLYRLEKGHFPPDVSRNQVPAGSECFYQQNSQQVPFDSIYDYESWRHNSDTQCYIAITFLGKNRNKEYRLPTATLFSNPGFHEVPDSDDLVLSLGIYNFSCNS